MLLKISENILSLIHVNLQNSRTFFFLFLFAVSCTKSPTDSRTGALTGMVVLEGQTDHSGITVALYKLAELDTTILRYNREYPLAHQEQGGQARRLFGGNVGFPISQATEFVYPPGVWRNHRLGEVVAEAKTKQDGSFEIDGVEQGTYNLVAEKAGFGWRYVYEVTSG